MVQKAESCLVADKTLQSNVSDYHPFISQGLVSLVGEESKTKPVCVLRDTGASQPLILKGILRIV